MIGQIAKETVILNSTEVEKEKVAGGVKLNFSQAVKDTLAQVDKNKVAIESIVGDIDVTTVAAVTVDYVAENGGVDAHLAGNVDVGLNDGDIIAVTYAGTVNGAPAKFDGAVEVKLTKDETTTVYNLKCKIEKGQTKLMVVEVGQEHNYLDDALLNLADLDAQVTTNTSAIATNADNIATNASAISTINSTLTALKKTRKTINLTVAGWTKEEGETLWKQTFSDNSVTADHLIEVVMDLTNQAKLTDGYVESGAGSYTFYTSVKPTEAISATVIFELTEAAV